MLGSDLVPYGRGSFLLELGHDASQSARQLALDMMVQLQQHSPVCYCLELWMLVDLDTSCVSSRVSML